MVCVCGKRERERERMYDHQEWFDGKAVSICNLHSEIVFEKWHQYLQFMPGSVSKP